MKAVVQRVTEGGVYISSLNYSEEIKKGIVILAGIHTDDADEDICFVAEKCCKLRIFDDEAGKMNLSVMDVNGEVLIISQFTLYGETAKGNRPSYIEAAPPEIAIPLYEKFISRIKQNLGDNKVKTGVFGEMMMVKILNDGPVTLLVESKKK